MFTANKFIIKQTVNLKNAWFDSRPLHKSKKMTIDYLKSLTIDEIFKLEGSTYYQGCKWDYECGEEMFDDEYDDDDDNYEPVINFIWLEKGSKKTETVYNFEFEDLLIIDSYTLILDEITSEIYIFDNNLLCDGVLDGFFSFDDYDITLTRNRKQSRELIAGNRGSSRHLSKR